MSLIDLTRFSLAMDLENPKTAHIGLSDVLTDGTSDDGQAILVPKNGNWTDWSAVANYVQQNLYK
jgi:hypothetical protein